MSVDEQLTERIRTALGHLPGVEEIGKMGGVSFMLDGKMCARAYKGGMMLRCEPDQTEELLRKKGAKRFKMKGKPSMKGWLVIGSEGTKTKKDFDFWINVAIDAARNAKPAKKKKK